MGMRMRERNEIYEICIYENQGGSSCMEGEGIITLDMGKEFYRSLGIFCLWRSSLHDGFGR